MTKTREGRSNALDRLQTARHERDRCAEQYDAASGSAGELPAFTDLQAAQEQFAAREAWLKWTEREY